MTKTIRTVTGDISPESFGPTMIHEHLVLDLSRIRRDDDPILSDSEEMDRELEGMKAAGCGGIVEVTNRGMGRDVEALRRMSERHGLPIVAATGYYKQTYYPEEVKEQSEEEIEELFVRELTEGIGDTGVRAGIIAEIGSSLNEMTAEEEKVFRAAARAQKRTGAPLSTHCELGTLGPVQVRLFDELGADLSKVSIGHQDLNGNRAEYETMLKAGVYIQFDTIGKNNYRPETERLSDLLYLLDRGYVGQLMLSCDITKKSYLKVNGGFGYEYLFTRFIPRLLDGGVSRREIETMLVENPRRFLSF